MGTWSCLAPAGKRVWCGPAALSAVTGKTVDAINRTWKKVAPGSPLKGMRVGDMALILADFGYGVQIRLERTHPRPTLAEYLHRTGAEEIRIVNITGHFIVVGRGMVWDRFYDEPAQCSTYLRRRVRQAVWFSPRRSSGIAKTAEEAWAVKTCDLARAWFTRGALQTAGRERSLIS